jgi:hypothetical protein
MKKRSLFTCGTCIHFISSFIKTVFQGGQELKMEQGFVIGMTIVASVSITASLSVILTLICFRELRSKPFMQIIAFISLSDFFGNIGYVPLQRPEDGSALCDLEAFLNDALYPCSWLWTTVLVYNLYTLAIEKRVPLITRHDHAICWLIPVVLFLISVPFSTFRTLQNRDFEVCTANGEISDIYHGITYYGMFFLSLIIMFYYQYNILALEKHHSAGVTDPAFIIAKAALQFYPKALFLCWFPHVCIVFLYYGGLTGEAFNICYYFTDILKVTHGAITAGIFFYYSPEARKLWYRTIMGTFQPNLRKRFDERTISEDIVITENCLQMRDSSSFQANGVSSMSSRPSNTYTPSIQ